MAAVYGNSLLTLFASGVTDADTFSSTSNPVENSPCAIIPPPDAEIWQQGIPGSTKRSFHIISAGLEEHIDKALFYPVSRMPLLSRGWVLQERLLSPRVVYLGGKELLWECIHHVASERCPLGTVMSTAQETTVKFAYQELRNQISGMEPESMTRAIGN